MGDDLRALLDDLTRYLQQEQQAGRAWYHDAGIPVDAPSSRLFGDEEAASPQATESAPAPIRPERPAPAPTQAPVSATPPAPTPDAVRPLGGSMTKEDRENAFVSECESFVRHALERIAARSGQDDSTTEPDMFTPAPAADAAPDKPAALVDLTAEVAGCDACKLHPTRTNTVFGAGDPDADLVFVGEAPGRNEDEQGLPFVGPAGKLLTDILRAIGLERDEVFICNILKCRPPENRDPEPDEVRACEPYLKRQLAILEPRVICCLGRHAAMTLLQTRASLRSMRERVHFYEGIPVMATYHPAALLRNPHWKRDTWDDVRKLRALHEALRAEG